MPAVSRLAGATSNIFTVFISDSASTTGAGKAALAYNTASLTAYYKRSNGTASVAITLATITTLGTFNSGGFKLIDDTNMTGHYEFHPPDAAFAAGAKWVSFHLQGASGMCMQPIFVELTAVDNQSATAFVSSVPAVVGAVGSVTSAVTVGTINADVITATSIATDAIDADALKADGVTKIATGVWASGTRTLSSFGTLVADIWAYATRILTAATNVTSTGGTVPITGAGYVSSDIKAIDASTTAATLQKWASLVITSGTVVTNMSGNSDTIFKTDLISTVDNIYGDGTEGGCILAWISGTTNETQAIRISGYDGTSKEITVESAFSDVPADGDRFIILGRIELPA